MAWRAFFIAAAAISMAFLTSGNLGDPMDPDLFSPDGVYLYDLNEHSEVWGRGFNMSVTPAEAWAISDECSDGAAAKGKEVSYLECLMPYVLEIYWTSDGERVHPRHE